MFCTTWSTPKVTANHWLQKISTPLSIELMLVVVYTRALPQGTSAQPDLPVQRPALAWQTDSVVVDASVVAVVSVWHRVQLHQLGCKQLHPASDECDLVAVVGGAVARGVAVVARVDVVTGVVVAVGAFVEASVAVSGSVAGTVWPAQCGRHSVVYSGALWQWSTGASF